MDYKEVCNQEILLRTRYYTKEIVLSQSNWNDFKTKDLPSPLAILVSTSYFRVRDLKEKANKEDFILSLGLVKFTLTENCPEVIKN